MIAADRRPVRGRGTGRRRPGLEAAPPASAAGVRAVAADRLALDRILGNLVDNALAVVAARGNGPASRRAPSKACRGSGGPAIAFSVRRRRAGVPAGRRRRGRSSASTAATRRGPARASGLGLSIVRELALAHGGTAIAENLSPRGARVSVILPVRPPRAPAPRRAGGRRSGSVSPSG